MIPEDPAKLLLEDPSVVALTAAGRTQTDGDVAFSFGEAEDDAYLLEYFQVQKEEVPCARVLDISDPFTSISYNVTDVTGDMLSKPESYERIIADWRAGKLVATQTRTQEEDEAAAEAQQAEEQDDDHEHDHDDL